MIRFATDNDINGIISLWREAFGDSEAEISFFLNNKFKPENTLIIEENSTVVSMLFLLDGHMQISGVDYPSYYLYAACTSNSCRGRGLMAKLLKFAKDTAKKRHIDFICLMPGEESLFNFYSKHGYLPIFSKKVLKINREAIINYKFKNNAFISSYCKTESARNNAFSEYDMFKWDCKAIKFAFEHTKLYGGQAFECREGYALYSKSGADIIVKEFAFAPDFLPAFTVHLKNNCDFDALIFHLPAEYPTDIGNYQIKKSAMLLPVTAIAQSVTPCIKNAYLGLTLD